jgi:hypothetical protein
LRGRILTSNITAGTDRGVRYEHGNSISYCARELHENRVEVVDQAQ